MLTLNDGRSELWQWDTGRTLTVDADCSQVHFSNKVFGRSIDVDVVDGVAIVPDILLQTDKDLNVWAFVGTAENGYTKISKVFKVNRRNKPADYVFTPSEQTTLAEIMERLDGLESIQDQDAIKNAVDDYLANNPIKVDETDPTVPEWAKQETPPDVKIPNKLPNPNALTFTGAVRETYDGSSAVTIDIPVSGGNVDLTGYATEQFVRDGYQPKGNYLTEVPEGYAKTDDVEPKGTAESKVSQHNTNTDAHNDIRMELKAINDRLTAFFDSDDQTLDELSEIVAYITSNKSLIDSITTSKVSVADIVNNLTTNVSNKPLSAAQGVVLKGLIDTVSNNLSNYQPKGDYALRSEIPTVPTNVSAFTNDAGYLTEHQDISGYAKIAETVSVKAQTFTDGQQTQARANIGAVSQAEFDTLVSGLASKPGVISDNKFDNVFNETGKIDYTTGQNANASTLHRTAEHHELWDDFDGTMYVGVPAKTSTSEQRFQINFYDENKTHIGYVMAYGLETPQLGDLKSTMWAASTLKDFELLKTAKFYRVCKTISWDVPIYISPITQPSADDIDYTYEYSEGGSTGNITIKAEKKLTGKVVVNFGDSIFGKRRPPDDISTKLAVLTGATVHNCGFSGCHMSNHWETTYNAFSMCNLVDAIVSKDWTSQDTAIADTSSNAVPSYFSEGLEILKGLDFSKADIVTIAYGTNDFTSGDALDNAENAYDKESFAGALRYSIETLLTAYPNLKIFICSQTYRFWMDDSYAFTEDSDTYQNTNGVKLTEFVEKTEEIARAYHLPFIDNYYGLGFNKFNRTVYFLNSQGAVTDGTHPNTVGCHLIAEHMANELF